MGKEQAAAGDGYFHCTSSPLRPREYTPQSGPAGEHRDPRMAHRAVGNVRVVLAELGQIRGRAGPGEAAAHPSNVLACQPPAPQQCGRQGVLCPAGQVPTETLDLATFQRQQQAIPLTSIV
jgi:hypothetical protein